MATFELILILFAAVLLSAVLEQLIPKVSLPLIQAGIGVVLALIATQPISITFNPDFFLLVFIAPILFNDAKHADKLGLWRNKGYILWLAIGLVVAIMLIVGFSLHAIVPSVPLAAAFALGAALGPTDAVAVLSLKKVAQVQRRESALLAGECLLNDASGVVSFQFAIAAAVTGTFTVLESSVSFLIAFFGGIVLGLFLAWVAHVIKDRVDAVGLDTNTFHVLFDVMLPFIIYLASELIGVSGILAVVAAGLLLSTWEEREIGPSKARLSIVSSNVWGVLEYALNGIVFVLLGLMLPRGMQSLIESEALSNWFLLAMVLGITAIIVVVRFIWVLVSDRLSRDPETGLSDTPQDRVRAALVTTIGGPKGAVTLSIIMSTPFFTASGAMFPQRALLIFLASGVIICTLLLANFLLPILAPAAANDNEDPKKVALAQREILRRVIERLADYRTKENTRAVRTVISSYNDRIDRLEGEAKITTSSDKLRVAVIEAQEESLFKLIDAGELDEIEGYAYLRRLSRASNYLQHKSEGGHFILSSIRHSSATWRALRRWFRKLAGKIPLYDDALERIKVQKAADLAAIDFLQGLMANEDSSFPSDHVTELLFAFQNSYRRSQGKRPSITSYTRTVDDLDDVQRAAYNFELEEIRLAHSREEISRHTANLMRDNVYLMLVDLDADLELA